jgi:hypothetical protein
MAGAGAGAALVPGEVFAGADQLASEVDLLLDSLEPRYGIGRIKAITDFGHALIVWWKPEKWIDATNFADHRRATYDAILGDAWYESGFQPRKNGIRILPHPSELTELRPAYWFREILGNPTHGQAIVATGRIVTGCTVEPVGNTTHWKLIF